MAKLEEVGFKRVLSLEEQIIYDTCALGESRLDKLQNGVFWCFDYQDYNQYDMSAIYEEYLKAPNQFTHMDMWKVGVSEDSGYLVQPKSWFYPAQLLAESLGCEFKEKRLSERPVQVSGFNNFDFNKFTVESFKQIDRSRKNFINTLNILDDQGRRKPRTICVNYTSVSFDTTVTRGRVTYTIPAFGLTITDVVKVLTMDEYKHRITVYTNKRDRTLNVTADEASKKIPKLMESLYKTPAGDGLLVDIVPEELIERRR
jgi:hypothetical protein